jgi:arylformamidase
MMAPGKNMAKTFTELTPGSIIDISQEVSADTAVWPGDTPFSLEWVMRLDDGCSCNVSTLHMSVHTGTHADAPNHFIKDGATPADVDLTRYIGNARVIHTTTEEAVMPSDLDGIDLTQTRRLLFRTPRSMTVDAWRDDFTFIHPETAALLATNGVLLVGLDTPSVDAMTSKTLDSHNLLTSGGVAILENLALQNVPEGEFELIALPLRLRDADSSPVRAILKVL